MESRVAQKLAFGAVVAWIVVGSASWLTPLTISAQVKPSGRDLPGMAGVTRPVDIPKWEVVSIRPCGNPTTQPNVRAGGMTTSPGMLRVDCLWVRWLAERAYVKWSDPEVRKPKKMYPISDGPSWVDTELYSIEAKAEGTPTMQEMRGPMLQALLEDRFGLRMRREIRKESVNELRVAESGLKMNAVKEEECVPLTPEQKEAHQKKVDEANKNSPVLVVLMPPIRCGLTGGGQPFGGVIEIQGRGVPMDFLLQLLPKEPIILDKTGLKGRFDFKLTYAPDSTTVRDPSVLLPEAPSGVDSLPVAIEKQLGLKLVRAIGPRDYYFVEHVERPTPN